MPCFRAKKYIADLKKDLFRKGAGPPTEDTKLDAVLEKVLALINDELQPPPNENDSDNFPIGKLFPLFIHIINVMNYHVCKYNLCKKYMY